MSFYRIVKYTDGSGDMKMGPFSTRKEAMEAVVRFMKNRNSIWADTFTEQSDGVWTAKDGSVEVWIEEH